MPPRSATNVAMAYYHSFAWAQIREPLERVLEADPGCGMAHWARALASLDNPFAWPGSSRRRRSARDRKFSRPRARPASSRSASATTWMRSPFSSASPTSAITAAAPRRSKRRWSSSYSAIRRTRRRRRSMRSSCQRTSTRPTGSIATSSAAAILEPIFKQQPQHPGSRTTSSTATTIRRSRTTGSTRRGSTAGSRLTRRMLFTCLRTSSPGSGRGKSPLNRTASRRALPKPRAARTQPADCTTCCTRWITWSTPISSSARTGRRARSSTR